MDPSRGNTAQAFTLQATRNQTMNLCIFPGEGRLGQGELLLLWRYEKIWA